MKPDYIFIGPHKSGTTWIDNYLRHRGDVCLPEATKETFFFDKQYHKGWDWYASLYGKRTPEHKICVEVAPSLLDKPEAAQRVAEDLPNVKVIGTLRNPIDRAIAHYFHYLKGGEPDWGFRKMAENHPAMVSNGLYYKNLNMWVELLGRDQVRLLNYHDLNTSPDGYVRKICDVLDLPYMAAEDEVLYARINEDGDPRFRLLAKAARRGARSLRSQGMHWLVNAVRQPAVRKIVYGKRPDETKRERLRHEAREFYQEFFDDFSHLDADFMFDTTTWRTQ
ncbi:sulfotransferase family protein [Roseobacter sp. CCS2]|uniref:sulfotransferase family protein n=1 Tax=Roseobacter sp. CCS2 TaxID=391593 RepID=UPI0000F401B0|nr:sulfotransferase [Roseobacter sp. CCS2]EBA13097.1 sulfotransferase [Roseobacter sp. CCS2]